MGKCVTDRVLCWMGPTVDQHSLVLQGVRSPMRGGWKENRPQFSIVPHHPSQGGDLGKQTQLTSRGNFREIWRTT